MALKFVYSQLAYSNITGDNGVLKGKWENENSDFYRSLVFTTDGYILTHGKAFKAVDITDQSTGVTVSNTNGKLTVTVNGQSNTLTPDVVISANNGLTVTNGVVGHSNSVTGASVGAAAASDTTISVPGFTFDDYGHITVANTFTATLNQVKSSIAKADTNYYLLGSASNAASDSEGTYKNTNVYVKNGVLYSNDKEVSNTDHTHSVTINGESKTIGASSVDLGSYVKALATAPTAGAIATWSGTDSLTASAYSITTDAPSASSTNTTIATSAAVWSAIANGITANDAMVFKGTIGAAGATVTALPLKEAKQGETYRVANGGYITEGGAFVTDKPASGNYQVVEAGDLVMCVVDGDASTTTYAGWTIAQTNITAADYMTKSMLMDSDNEGNKRYVKYDSEKGLYIDQKDNDHFRAINVNGGALLSTDSTDALNIVANGGLQAVGNDNTITISHTNSVTAGNSGLYKIAYDAQGHITGTSAWDPNTLTIKSDSAAITDAVAYDPDSATAITIDYKNGLQATYASGVYTVGHVNTGKSLTKGLYEITVDEYGHVTAGDAVTSLVNPNSIAIKINGGDVEGTSLYTYDGSDAKNLNIVSGTGINLTTIAGQLTITNSGVTSASAIFSGTGTNDYEIGTLTVNGSTVTFRGHDTNTWRPFSGKSIKSAATATADAVLEDHSCTTHNITFGNSMLITNNGTTDTVDIVWAEIDTNGKISYAV